MKLRQSRSNAFFHTPLQILCRRFWSAVLVSRTAVAHSHRPWWLKSVKIYCLLKSQASVVRSHSGEARAPSALWHHQCQHIAWASGRVAKPGSTVHHCFPTSVGQNSHDYNLPAKAPKGKVKWAWWTLSIISATPVWAQEQKTLTLFSGVLIPFSLEEAPPPYLSSKFWDLGLNWMINGDLSEVWSLNIPGSPDRNTISVVFNSVWINSQRFWKSKIQELCWISLLVL